MKIQPTQKELNIEKAIIMLVECVKENCINPKPLILHSARVGMKLFELGQPEEVVIAGILHDLVEDTNCAIKQIESAFGKKVSDLVYALTQEKIEDYKERWHVLLNKIKKAGKPAMIIKIIDFNDNLVNYTPLIEDKEYLQIALWKAQFTIDSLEPLISDLPVFQEFKKNVNKALDKKKIYGKTYS